jgi:DNA modification methylase
VIDRTEAGKMIEWIVILVETMKTPGKRNGNRTRTSAFGSPGRAAHDSSRFYQSRLYNKDPANPAVVSKDNEVPLQMLDRVLYKSSEKMAEVPDNSVHLMVTSPPYNATKEYDRDLTLEEYRTLLKTVFTEVYQKLVNGGRACVNMANLGRKPYIPLHGYVIQDMLDIGYLMRGEIIWNKASSASSSTAWGTWRSAANPVLRDIHEYILVFSKGSFNRNHNKGQLPPTSTITRDEFLEFSKSVWTFPAESAHRIGHPAPFPIELPYRLIQLYTYQGEVVLDPFCGSGTTCLAAIKTARHYIGYDNIEDYVKLAEKRIQEYRCQATVPNI